MTQAASAVRSQFSGGVEGQIAPLDLLRVSLSITNSGPDILYIGQGSAIVSSDSYTYALSPAGTYTAEPNEVSLEHRGFFPGDSSTAQITMGYGSTSYPSTQLSPYASVQRGISYESLITGIVGRMGLDPLSTLQSSTQNTLTEYLNTRIAIAWEWDQWPDLCMIDARDVTVDANGVRSIAKSQPGLTTITDVFGIFADNPDAMVSPRTEEWVMRSDKIILDPKKSPATLYVDYRPEPYQYTATEWDSQTAYAAGDLVWNAKANGGDGHCYQCLIANSNQQPDLVANYWNKIPVPTVLAEYLKIAIYADTLREDGQIDKADDEEARAENALIRQSDKLSLRSGKSSGSYSVRTR